MEAGLNQAWLWISLLFAAAECFFGYKLKRIWASVVGFLLGFLLGSVAAGALFSQNTYAVLIALSGGLLLGIIGAVTTFFFYRIGMFLYIGVNAFSFVYSLIYAFFPAEKTSREIQLQNLFQLKFENIHWGAWITALVLGILAGILTLLFTRNVVIFTTALSGGTEITRILFKEIMGIDYLWLIVCFAAVVICLGLLIQFTTTKKYKAHRR